MVRRVINVATAVADAKALRTQALERPSSCMPEAVDAVKHSAATSVVALADAIILAGETSADSAELEAEREEEFVVALTGDILAACSQVAMPNLFRSLLTIVRDVFEHVIVKGPSAGRSDIVRIGEGIILRRAGLGLQESEDEMDDYETKLLTWFALKNSVTKMENRRHSDAGAGSGAEQATSSRRVSAPTDGVQGEYDSKPDVPAYVSDGSRVSRAVQSSFSTIDVDDTSKFSGDLTHAPAYDMFEKRYVALMNSSFSLLEEEKRVFYLSEALTGDAQRFFYEQLMPRLGRALPGLDSARPPPTTGVAPNIRTLSAAFAALEARFCTHDARNVLHQAMAALNLSRVRAETKCDLPDALRELKRRIDKLSANGPREYRNEICKIDTFVKCLAGEAWTLMPIMRCKDPNSTQTLQFYVDALVSYLHTSASIVGTTEPSQPTAQASSAPGSPFGAHRVFTADQDADSEAYALGDDISVLFGETRAQPRFKQRSAGGFRRSRSYGNFQNPSRNMQRDGYPRRNSSSGFRPSLASGSSLRKMLTDQAEGEVCFRCKKPGHRWRQCRNPKQTVLEASRAFMVQNPEDVSQLVGILAANCDDAYYCEDSAGTDEGSDSGSVIDDQNDAINDVFASFAAKSSSDF